MEHPSNTKPPTSTQGGKVVPRLEWLGLIARDGSLPSISARLAIVITGYVNGKTGIAWPSQETLAKEIGASVDTVRRGLNALVDAGHLVRLAVGGPGRSAQYRLAIEAGDPSKSATKQTAYPSKSAGDIFANLPATSSQDCYPNSFDKNSIEGNSISLSSKAEKSAVSHRDDLFIDPPKAEIVQGEIVPPSRSSYQTGPANHDAGADEFDRFWAAYPRREAKGAARKAWAAAIKRGVAASVIISGARRYAGARAAEPDPDRRARFTAMPASWLSAERWEDEAVSSSGAGVLIDGATGETIVEPAKTHRKSSPDLAGFAAALAATMEDFG